MVPQNLALAIPPGIPPRTAGSLGLVKDCDTGRVQVEIVARASPGAQPAEMDILTDNPRCLSRT